MTPSQQQQVKTRDTIELRSMIDGKPCRFPVVNGTKRQFERGKCWSAFCDNRIWFVHLTVHGNANFGRCYSCTELWTLRDFVCKNRGTGRWVLMEKGRLEEWGFNEKTLQFAPVPKSREPMNEQQKQKLDKIRKDWKPGARLTTWGPKDAAESINFFLSIIDSKPAAEIRHQLLQGIIGLRNPPYHLNMTSEDRLLHACLCAYQKHVRMNDNLGWDELGEILHNAICEAIGDDAFVEWNEGPWE